ncbi:MAG TPA: nucleotide-binding domain containing protein, partial [Tepidisphaeraceae bacterium]|nr:nucleotide-binding domain containing protein [Tepidisphaeraceae bacterium]
HVNATILPAGGADFFTAILQSRGFSKRTTASPPLDLRNHLMVCGSASESSRSFVDAAAASWVCPMPDVVFAGTHGHEDIGAWRDAILELMHASRRAVIAIRQPAQPDRAEPLRKTIAEVVARILAVAQPPTLLIEGGATAAAVFERLEWRTLKVEQQLAPGVVALRPMESPHQRLVLKPGSYPWPTGVA